MSILHNEQTGIFSLETAHSLYQMKADATGVLLHLYYGGKTGGDMDYLIRYTDRGFSGNPYELSSNRGYSLDTLPQEYSGNGVGDFRLPAVQVLSENGSRSVDLRFSSYTATKGRLPLKGLPFAREAEDTETLTITLRDSVIGLDVELKYHVFPSQDVIVRSARLINTGNQPLVIEKAASACVDFLYGDFDVIHFHGRHCMERIPERLSLPRGVASFGSRRGMSSHYHDIIRHQVISPRWQTAKRPVLINSWEAAYFDFDAEKILRFARSAKEMGMEMLVLDDGWFGKRDDDNAGLGDWVVNEKKLGCSMQKLSDQIHALGLEFGLWFEPEMVNEDSDLYRAHPDWALADPDRKPMLARNQLVLDMSRQDVVDYLFDAMCAVLDHAKIEYVKWDFNRSISNCYSHALPADRQGEVAHRFMLGTYQLLDRLLTRYPDLMIEGCSGGGGRFDAGMLYYCPQIWCSDDSDAVERLEIQRGTSYGYPASTMGAHVSASPNHQTGRMTPLSTRSIVAQSGTFGYELNPEKLTDAEKEEIKKQISDYHRFELLIAEGSYYRLTELDENRDFEAWMFVSPDQKEALVNLVMTHVRANGPFPHIRLQGLNPQYHYRVEGENIAHSGLALVNGGFAFPQMHRDYPAAQLHLVAIDEA